METPSQNCRFALHSLGWNAFQQLCATILRELWGQTFQQFANVHDAGRDGAFYGDWKHDKDKSLLGPTVVQCKFTAQATKSLRVSDLTEEIEKSERLARRRLARNYVLITNATLTGDADIKIRERFQAISGIRQCICYGLDWICSVISENVRLRMLVPRMYGLGDLSQILDERAYLQAKEILSSMEEELAKFVVTKAHQDSVRALNEYRFVLLLGEPACGKSTIASALALGAADQWGSRLIKIDSPEEFRRHWNPEEPSQFFWIDDAFGQTQYERPRALAWNYAFPALAAAIKKGATLVLTSRDYIYRTALEDLKEEAFPLLREAKVVIEVQKLSRDEREQILYNHLKLGNQSAYFRSKVKPFLSDVAASPHFLPEIARRLGNSFFTKSLALEASEIMRFVENPNEFLRDVTRNLDDANRAALGLIFMRGGALPSLSEGDSNEDRTLSLLNSNLGSVRKALRALNGTLVTQIKEEDSYVWRFKHPTIRDAYGSLVAEEPDLMQIYLAGTKIKSILREVTCGAMRIKGVKLIIPRTKWAEILKRLSELDNPSEGLDDALLEFLADRCHRDFLKIYLELHPNFVASLRYSSYLRYDEATAVAARLYACRLLPSHERKRFVAAARKLAVGTPDAEFLEVPKIRRMFKEEEVNAIMGDVQRRFLPNLRSEIKYRRSACIRLRADPYSFLWTFQRTIKVFALQAGQNRRFRVRFQKAYDRLEQIMDRIAIKQSRATSKGMLASTSAKKLKEPKKPRSVFDDVDS